MQGERSVVAEAVERPPARDGSRESTVLTLIQEGAGLLPIPRRGQIANAVFHDLDLSRHLA
jgi:hypothetical protein